MKKHTLALSILALALAACSNNDDNYIYANQFEMSGVLNDGQKISGQGSAACDGSETISITSDEAYGTTLTMSLQAGEMRAQGVASTAVVVDNLELKNEYQQVFEITASSFDLEGACSTTLMKLEGGRRIEVKCNSFMDSTGLEIKKLSLKIDCLDGNS